MSYLKYNGQMVQSNHKYLIQVPPPLILKDLDGNQYGTIQIGSQLWTVNNLRVSKYADGTPIPYDTNWVSSTIGQYVNYNWDSQYDASFGKLYNWYSVNDPSGLVNFTDLSDVPQSGWRIPTDLDISTLEFTLGGISVAGGAMKETGTMHWTSPNTGATNLSGLSLRGSGFRSHTGGFYSLKDTCYLWSSTGFDGTSAYGREISYIGASISRYAYEKHSGMSIRCVKDN
jgi:uncharacterized protein (TIGR02145 family)